MALMIFHSKLFLVSTAFVSLAACSIYESSGRKQLESNAFKLAGLNLTAEGCATKVVHTNEVLHSEDLQTRIYEKASNPFEIRIAVKSPSEISCSFSFQDESELNRQLPVAIALTINESQKANP
jgi:hypothetical protein